MLAPLPHRLGFEFRDGAWPQMFHTFMWFLVQSSRVRGSSPKNGVLGPHHGGPRWSACRGRRIGCGRAHPLPPTSWCKVGHPSTLLGVGGPPHQVMGVGAKAPTHLQDFAVFCWFFLTFNAHPKPQGGHAKPYLGPPHTST